MYMFGEALTNYIDTMPMAPVVQSRIESLATADVWYKVVTISVSRAR